MFCTIDLWSHPTFIDLCFTKLINISRTFIMLLKLIAPTFKKIKDRVINLRKFLLRIRTLIRLAISINFLIELLFILSPIFLTCGLFSNSLFSYLEVKLLTLKSERIKNYSCSTYLFTSLWSRIELGPFWEGFIYFSRDLPKPAKAKASNTWFFEASRS